ncbi:MAG: metal ABC transporter substrate-binding protein [Erysipelotrichaceae bacterium]|nr:metal ABC transporter substrate-binding protein [Erysipelotrichaceae bacterium]
MKKVWISILSILLMTSFLSACGEKKEDAGEEKIKIVTTIFPEYDWVRNIVGAENETIEVDLLVDSGADLHSFQPTAEDILKISTCDLFVYVGGESDEWVNDVLRDAMNKDMKVVNLLESLGDSVKQEEVIEGMQEEEHDHEEGEYDEHVWLSLRNASKLVKVISEAIVSIDPDNQNTYEENTAAYLEKVKALDKEYQEVTKKAEVKTLLFADRFPFRYMVDDYGLNYYAVFVGCSAETEASFETMSFLTNKVDELGLSSIMTIESSDQKIAKTVKENSKTKDQQILTMDSMQSVTAKDVADGTTYLSIMEENLSVLKDALK